jgi:hypothetical protein
MGLLLVLPESTHWVGFNEGDLEFFSKFESQRTYWFWFF